MIGFGAKAEDAFYFPQYELFAVLIGLYEECSFDLRTSDPRKSKPSSLFALANTSCTSSTTS